MTGRHAKRCLIALLSFLAKMFQLSAQIRTEGQEKPAAWSRVYFYITEIKKNKHSATLDHIMGLFKGRYPNEWPDRTMAWQIFWKMKYSFSKRFCRKSISLVHTIQDLTDLVRNVLVKVTTAMVWRVSSDKWKAPSDSDTITDFFLSIVSFFKLWTMGGIAIS